MKSLQSVAAVGGLELLRLGRKVDEGEQQAAKLVESDVGGMVDSEAEFETPSPTGLRTAASQRQVRVEIARAIAEQTPPKQLLELRERGHGHPWFGSIPGLEYEVIDMLAPEPSVLLETIAQRRSEGWDCWIKGAFEGTSIDSAYLFRPVPPKDLERPEDGSFPEWSDSYELLSDISARKKPPIAIWRAFVLPMMMALGLAGSASAAPAEVAAAQAATPAVVQILQGLDEAKPPVAEAVIQTVTTLAEEAKTEPVTSKEVASDTTTGSAETAVTQPGGVGPVLKIPSFVFVNGEEAAAPRTVKVDKPWTKLDVALDSIFWTTLVVDWLQTRTIAKNSVRTTNIPEWKSPVTADGYSTQAAYSIQTEGLTEKNPMLGRHPSTRKVDAYFFLSGLTYAVVSRNLPESWRRAYMLTSVSLEAYCVGNNIRLGIRMH